MQTAKIEIFFSCSFADPDKKVNDLLLAICRGLGLQPSNVSTGSALPPPAVAKEKIETAQALVAVCTKRDELKAGGFHMPQAVHDEVSFAFGKDTPVLMIVEEGVVLAGFKSNFGTFLPFSRSKITSPEFVEKAVEALHGLRTTALGPYQASGVYGVAESHAEYVHHMTELRAHGDDFEWKYSTTKKLVYTHPSKRGIPSSYFTTVTAQIPDDAPNLRWEVKLDDSSRGIRLEPKVEKQTPSGIEAVIKLVPTPEEGDFIEYSTTAESRYFNAVWLDEAPADAPIHLNRGDYKCADGLIFIHRTKRAILEFRFAKEYGLSRDDIVPFVASYSSAIDYEVESELNRITQRFEQFGESLILRMELESPLPGHLYGVAWNPKPRPELSPDNVST
ncbi:MAG TPA: hypothetical protein VEW71_00255 [Allosphingosinicella sp.]|nr:hypothetical protein [Allosphingosinicella sp.]